MMAQSNLNTDIDILLEKSTLVAQNDIKTTSGSLIKIQGPYTTVATDPENYELIHKQAESLKRLFFQNNKTKQAEIIKQLIRGTEKGGEISRTASLTIIEVGNIDLLIDQIKDNFVDHRQHGYHITLRLLNGYIHYFWPNLKLAQVKELRDWAKQVNLGKNKLGQAAESWRVAYSDILQVTNAVYNQTTHILAEDIEERINTGYNPEINEDKEEIKKEINRFGFPADLSETLDKIDQKFSQAHDAFDFKGCMDLIRAFTERLYRSILDSYGDEGKKINEKDAQAVASFFIAKGLVADHFAQMIAQFRHFLSDQASHRLKSREEDARLTKNMVIEMSLYLLRRFENN